MGAADFTTLLGTTLGISDVGGAGTQISADSVFALVSSGTDTTLASDGTTNFSGFELDLVAGIGGTGFAQARNASTANFSYAFYEPDGTYIFANDPGFTFRFGYNVEDTDSVVEFGQVTSAYAVQWKLCVGLDHWTVGSDDYCTKLRSIAGIRRGTQCELGNGRDST